MSQCRPDYEGVMIHETLRYLASTLDWHHVAAAGSSHLLVEYQQWIVPDIVASFKNGRQVYQVYHTT